MVKPGFFFLFFVILKNKRGVPCETNPRLILSQRKTARVEPADDATHRHGSCSPSFTTTKRSFFWFSSGAFGRRVSSASSLRSCSSVCHPLSRCVAALRTCGWLL